ncbi:MAG: hypothetical protein COV76_06190 [Candidatus Omnitrophica bacterium CG11_big_fil_rev_8_21_14_0_20_64_10]|nr:MAG: hypothetical protein COV76_06190 [Candidatus Omnitrophica bacterium CG11_big_fil_rev_8_21_14_0_20_64_10]
MEGSAEVKESLQSVLGSRVRFIRKEQKLSLEQLAARSGVALATLSRIENGKVTGNLRTHQRIADAFGISIPELYQGMEQPEPESSLMEAQTEEAETFTYDEKASAVLLARQIHSKQMLPQLILLKPGGKTALEQYRRGTERWIFGLEGTVRAEVNGKPFTVSPGGTLYFKGWLPHRFENAGETTVRLISVTSPAVF